ncbi:transcriptional regulator, BadM/Rrf2 family [Clostridium cavendishii DSM 21758]|uniref:Transcriptional regulator, BadM/Rrf2 family n=1 Tax=Clostridium cavendishii DSM 21758 TaxID=1121302 RepID=A0A1M6U806_9CLOT|nr:Rrf2 family transcriptional regulator [Clostridium cavendishii]SHK65405.1 transcriptional regulator, BadM/Rrf2 family [Clostridium cavendishii DSM 21758]
MKITQETDYALRIILYLCKLNEGTKLDAKTLAEKEMVPIRFLLKILRKLTHGGIINSFRGVKGGYTLALKPEKITLRMIMEIIDGPIYVAKCLSNNNNCNANRSPRCEMHVALNKVQRTLTNELDSINFRDILDGKIK